MKTTLLKASVILALASSAALASDKDTKDTKNTKASTTATTNEKPKTQLAAVPKHEKVALTGSYIKKDVRRNGQITDGPDPVLVLDSKTIRNSGAADLRQLLVRQGVNR